MVETKKLRNPFVVAAVIVAVVFYSGIGNVHDSHAGNFICALPEEEIFSLKGNVISSPQKSGDRYTFYFTPENAFSKNGASSSCQGNLKAYVPAKQVEAFFPGKLYSSSKGNSFFCEAGAVVQLYGKFSNGNFYATDAKTLDWKKGWCGRLTYFRALCRLQFRRLMYAWGKAGGLLLSLLSGAREYTEAETADGFRNAGLSHILALSGMHLSLVSSIALMFGARISGKKIAYFLQAVTVVIFVWFAGATPSLLRAFICSMILWLAAVAGIEKPDMISVLCVSFLLHIIIKKEDLTSAAFMLSYGALLGILTIGELFHNLFSRFFPRVVSSTLSASCGAQIFTAPISISLFGTFAPIGIIATAVVSPCVTIFIYSGAFCIFICLLFPVLVPAAGFFLNAIYLVIKLFVMTFAKCPALIFD